MGTRDDGWEPGAERLAQGSKVLARIEFGNHNCKFVYDISHFTILIGQFKQCVTRLSNPGLVSPSNLLRDKPKFFKELNDSLRVSALVGPPYPSRTTEPDGGFFKKSNKETKKSKSGKKEVFSSRSAKNEKSPRKKFSKRKNAPKLEIGAPVDPHLSCLIASLKNVHQRNFSTSSEPDFVNNQTAGLDETDKLEGWILEASADGEKVCVVKYRFFPF